MLPEPTPECPNPVVAQIPAPDGGTVRIYWNGMVDAVDGEFYVISPGFSSIDECLRWLRDPASRTDW